MNRELYKKYWDEWLKHDKYHKAVMELIAEFGANHTLSEVLQSINKRQDINENKINEIYAADDKILQKILEKKGDTWVIQQIANGVSTDLMIKYYKEGKI